MNKVRIAVAAVGLLPAIVVGLSRLLWWSRLPGLLPSHWSGLGDPNGYSGRQGTWTAALAFTAATALIGAVAVLSGRRPPLLVRFVAVLAAMLGGIVAGAWLAVGWATLSAGSAQDATLGLRVLLPLLGTLLALPAAVLLRRHSGTPRDDIDEPRRELAPDDQPTWQARAGSTPLLVVGVLSLVGAVVATALLSALWPLLVIPVVLLGLLSRIEVSVDRRGLRVLGGPLRVPLKRIPLQDVVSADVAQVRPREWGGWGYRVGPGRSAIVLRRGPGLALDLDDDTRFAVTVPDAQTGAALLNTLRAPAASGS